MEPTVSFFAGAENTRKRKRVSSDSVQDQETEEIHIHVFKKCRLCNGTHSEINCTRFTTQETRLTEIRKRRLCFNCLGNHQVSICRSKFRCRQCQRKHHTCICDNEITATELDQNADSFISRSTSDSEAAVLHATNQQKETVFLKTTVAPVSSRDVCREANILFDEGATRSFITQEDALQLPQDKSEEVQLASFGGHVEEMRQSKSSTVFIRTDDGRRLPIHVLIVPRISTPLTSKLQHVKSLEYLRDLKLAHPLSFTERFNVELLIGADSYWSIVEDQTVRGDGPTAVKSKIGYLLSGPLRLPITESAREHMMTLITFPPATTPVQKMSIHVQHNAKKSISRESSTNKDDQRRIKKRSRRRGKGRVKGRASRRAATAITAGRSDKVAITEGRFGGRATATHCEADLVTVNDEVQPPPSSWRRPWRRPWRRRPRSLREGTNMAGHENATHPGSHDPYPRRERTRGTIYPRIANTRYRSTRTMTGGDDHLAGRRMSWTAGRRADRGDVTHTKPRATST